MSPKSYPQMSFFDTYDSRDKYCPERDLELELEVVFETEDGEECDVIYGNTKAECWYKFFVCHEEVSMSMVTDYSWA